MKVEKDKYFYKCIREKGYNNSVKFCLRLQQQRLLILESRVKGVQEIIWSAAGCME